MAKQTKLLKLLVKDADVLVSMSSSEDIHEAMIKAIDDKELRKQVEIHFNTNFRNILNHYDQENITDLTVESARLTKMPYEDLLAEIEKDWA